MNTTIRLHVVCNPFGEVTGDDRCLTRVPWGETVVELRAFASHLESKANHAFAFDKRIILQVDIDNFDTSSDASLRRLLMREHATKKRAIKTARPGLDNDRNDQRGAIAIRAVMLGWKRQ